nr:MAG TPA: hypothetical protein [Caudoviricetes sp.]
MNLKIAIKPFLTHWTKTSSWRPSSASVQNPLPP